MKYEDIKVGEYYTVLHCCIFSTAKVTTKALGFFGNRIGYVEKDNRYEWVESPSNFYPLGHDDFE